MGALAEIQKKGDSMLAGIRRQREVGVLMLIADADADADDSQECQTLTCVEKLCSHCIDLIDPQLALAGVEPVGGEGGPG